MTAPSNLTLPTVQLLHTLPNEVAHIDWMIARDVRSEQPLVTFRLTKRVDELEPVEHLDAERIADHRPHYLDYEGPVSGDRGIVQRLARGVASIAGDFDDDDAVTLFVHWQSKTPATRPDVTQQVQFRRLHSAIWRMTVLPPNFPDS